MIPDTIPRHYWNPEWPLPSLELDAACAAEDPELWEFVTSLPADYIAPYEEHIDEFSKTVRPVHTTQQIVFNYILDGMMKPKFRLRNGQQIFTGLVAA